jgi:hypothetical protein
MADYVAFGRLNSEGLLASVEKISSTGVRYKPEQRLYKSARQRARSLGIRMSVTAEDIRRSIPNNWCCPITGLMFKNTGVLSDSSMTLDRINPSQGYVPENIAVISALANKIKQNCTDPIVFERLADYVERYQRGI